MSESQNLQEKVFDAFKNGRRLAAPLVGFPGVNLVGSSIKLAQQNYKEHFKVVKANYDRFKPDAIFPLMDLSVEVNALGKEVIFPENDSATIVKNSFTIEELEKLKKIEIEYDARLLSYVETIKMMVKELPNTVLKGAYVTGPYTIAGLLMGADEAAMSTITNPEMLAKVCDFAESLITKYIDLLINAGAQAICILEPSGVMLSPKQFEEFSSNYVKNIIKKFKNTGVEFIYHVCGNTTSLIEKMYQSGVNALSLDSEDTGVNLFEIAETIPENVIIIGNVNPVGKILNGKPDEVEKIVSKLLNEMNDIPNFILSTGCDLPLDTPIENIECFMNIGKNFKMKK